MAGRDLDADFLIGASNKARIGSGFSQHWKYPQTVGNDTVMDDLNFNSHATSQYAIQRMSRISEVTHEPFMLFEFMKITTPTEEKAEQIRDATQHLIDEANTNNELKTELNDLFLDTTEGLNSRASDITESIEESGRIISEKFNAFLDLAKPAKRHYTGSIALYMPTDIQVNDSLVYTEDTRRTGALVESLRSGEGIGDADMNQLANNATITSALGGIGLLGGRTAGLVSALAAYGIGDIVTQELQRSLGRKGNPNEFAAYENTTLRTFTFNWTLLPDNEYESDQVAGLIKFFRKSAHATKGGPLKITVPDECIVSFHGAKDMIQIPPCFIESVNVTYNPNVSSFFRRNNSPVEVGLGVTLKEIVPIYSDDVERGY